MSVEEITIGDPFFSVKLIKSNKNIFCEWKGDCFKFIEFSIEDKATSAWAFTISNCN